MIGALIPAYEAQETVGLVAAGALRHTPTVLVVDDGSRDRTAARAVASGAQVIRHPANQGKGAALRSGFMRMRELRAEAVITLDADMQHEPDDIPRFVEAFAQRRADLIIGSREEGFDRMTPGRQLGNRFSCRALRFFTGLELNDSQSGFRLYSAGFLERLDLRRDAYDAEMEALLVAARQGRRVESIRVSTRAADGSATSYYRPWLDTYRICRTVVLFAISTF